MTSRLIEALRKVETPGAFSVRVTAPPDDLSLEVKDVGPVRLPVSARTARKLVGVARPASFGRGERTVRDPRVRDTWEIARSRVKIDQRAWRRTLAPQLERIGTGLGLPEGARLEARLHKMLVYEPGQFFRFHQDSEKSDDMVGTLSVVLPCAYTGGAEVIEHRGEKVTYRRTASSGNALSFVAFYADCHHEVRPIKSGYRVVLVYNLSVRRKADPVTAAIDECLVDELVEGLRRHFDTPMREYQWRGPTRPEKLVYLLDHDYTQRSIAWNRLKGADARRVAALRAAAGRLDCEVLLGIAEIQEVWDCHEEGGSWGAGDDYWTPDDDEDVEDEQWDGDQVGRHRNARSRARGYRATDLVLNDLIDSGVEVCDLLDDASKPAGLAPLRVESTELCFTRAHDATEPLHSDYEPYMGNYGNTLDRWYRRAAVVLWPRARAFSIRGRGDPTWAIGEIGKRLTAKAAEEARDLTRALLPDWRGTAGRGGKRLPLRVMKVAGQLADADLAAGLLRPLSLSELSRTSVTQLANLVDAYGFDWGRALFEHWYERERGDEFYEEGDGPELAGDGDGFELLEEICSALHAGGGESGHALAAWLVTKESGHVEKAIQHALADPRNPHVRRHLSALGSEAARIVRATAAARASDQRDAFLRHLAERDTGALMPLLVSMLRRCREHSTASDLPTLGLATLVAQCADALDEVIGRPARRADDWSIDPPMVCDCALCDTLRGFLADRVRRTIEWPLAKDDRRHVHHQIDGYELPVSHVTRRVGRPYRLVLTKRKVLFASDASRRAELERDLAWLRRERRRFG